MDNEAQALINLIIQNKTYTKNNIRLKGVFYISDLRKVRIGEKRTNNQGCIMEITDYRNRLDIDVMFDDGTKSLNKTYQNFKNGEVKNVNFPSVYGLGFIGMGEYKQYISASNPSLNYTYWANILSRVTNQHKHTDRYKDVEICDEWRNFQNFSKWFFDNYYTVEGERMEIDKDILVKNSKIYSPETSILVPKSINGLFSKADKSRGDLPIGVIAQDGLYISRMSKRCEHTYLGCFKTKEEAFETYKFEKEKYIKEVADVYKCNIPNVLYKAMYNYKGEITD